MATRLEDLVINRVDLVDRGANPLAHVLLYKRTVPVQKHADVDGNLASDLRLRKVDSRGQVPIRVADRVDPQAWADALHPVVQKAGTELWVAYRQNLKRDAIVKLAAMLPSTVTRYVFLPNESGPVIAYPGQTVADAMRPVAKVLADCEALCGGPLQKGITMDMPTPAAIAKGVAENDVVVLRKCKEAFPAQLRVAREAIGKGALDAQETNELQMMDPQGRLSIDEKAAHLAASRWPDLYEGYVAAVTRGIS